MPDRGRPIRKRRYQHKPFSRSPYSVGVGTGEVFGLSREQATSEGLFFSGMEAAKTSELLEMQGITPQMPTGIQSVDRARMLRDPRSIGVSMRDLPEAGDDYYTLDEAKEILKASNMTAEELGLTAVLEPHKGSTVSKWMLRRQMKVLQDQRDVERRIESGINGFFDQGASLTGGILGSMMDPGDLGLSVFPISRAASATRIAARATRMSNTMMGRAMSLRGQVGAKLEAFKKAGASEARREARLNLAKRTVERAKAGAIDGFGGAVVAEPFVYLNNVAAGRDYTVEDSMMNLVFGTLMGAGLHAGLAGAKDAAAGRWRGAELPPYGRNAQEAADLPPAERQEQWRTQLANAAHGKPLNPEFVRSLMGVGPGSRSRLEPLADSLGVRPLDEVVEELAALPPEELQARLGVTAGQATKASRDLSERVLEARAETARVASEVDKLRGGKGFETLPDFVARVAPDDDVPTALAKAREAGFEATAKDIEAGSPILRAEDRPKAMAALGERDAILRAADEQPRLDAEGTKRAIRDHNATMDRAPSELEAVSEMDRLAREADTTADDVALSEALANDTIEGMEAMDALDPAVRDEIAEIEATYKDTNDARRALVNCLMGWAK